MFNMRELEFIRDSIDLEMTALKKEKEQLDRDDECVRYKILKDIRSKVKKNILEGAIK